MTLIKLNTWVDIKLLCITILLHLSTEKFYSFADEGSYDPFFNTR